MKLKVMGEVQAINYSKQISEPTVIVSIVSRIENPIKFHENENIKDIFRLYLNDLNVDYQDEKIHPEARKAPVQGDFDGLKEFVDKNKDLNFVVHCAAGISRSAGVALAICEYLDIENDILTSGNYDHNTLCYRLALYELTKYKVGSAFIEKTEAGVE